ncbi:hypothetical protein ACIRJR_10310 [Streptomyces sp. NPDC102402]|uniref:hypothetical protein n=1 Tax=Streptomyces sp. NPDC102402 TaxID=3366169 RepID=UPI0037FC7E1D
MMRDAAEGYGEKAAKRHYQFDQVWKRKDGGYVAIEAKSSVRTELGARNLPNGRRVSQGTRDYFLDIISEMKKRSENNIDELTLADDLEAALDAGKLEYVVVKGEINSGEYAGYQMRQFDITDRSAP